MKERTLKTNIMALLKARGIPARRFGGGPFTPVGWPDIVACLPPNGRLLMIEAKTPRGQLSDAQMHMLAVFSRAGALCRVVRRIEEVEELLDVRDG